MVTSTIRLSDEMSIYLDEQAKKLGLTKNAMMIMAIKTYIDQQVTMEVNKRVLDMQDKKNLEV